MNRLIRLSLMLLLATMACQQLQAKKHPFVMEGKKWVYAKNDGTKKITYVIHGDTVINGEAFMKFFRSENNGNSIYFGAVQEIDKMVFIVYADEVQKGLVYDFREKPDSPVTLASGLTLNVSFECKQEFDSELYNRIRYSHPPFPNGEAFIEYMSAIDGFGGMEMDLFCRDITDINYTLMECYENGEYLFNAFDTYTWTVYNWMPYACSLVKEGKVWKYQSTNDMTGVSYQYEYFIEGDTLIGGEAYKKLYKDQQKYLYQGALREDGAKVYFVRSGHETAEFLYDFDLPVGESMYYGDYYVTVLKRDVITVKDVERKRLEVRELHTDPYNDLWFGEAKGWWVEGIGCDCDLLAPFGFLSYSYSDCLLSVYEDGNCIFNRSDFNPKKNPFVKEGKRWEYVRGDVAPVFHYVYTLQGDTTICGKAYKKMYRSKDKGEPEYVSAMREEDGKVYKVFKGSEEEHLLFDFNAKVGDVVFSDEFNGIGLYLTVKDIDHVLVGDREQRRFILTMTEIRNNGTDRIEYPGDVVWVEGIGSIGLFDSPGSVFGSGGGGWLLGCYEDDRMVFANEDFYPGQEISYEPLTIDDAQNIFGWGPCLLTLAGSRVESCEDDCLVVADVNSGNKVRLFGMGCDFAEGTQLGGTIAGLLCVWNKMRTLFPTRFTDVSTILSDADGIRDVVDGENAHGESLYDLQGRSVGNGISHLKKGIYIIEGRKTVVR